MSAVLLSAVVCETTGTTKVSGTRNTEPRRLIPVFGNFVFSQGYSGSGKNIGGNTYVYVYVCARTYEVKELTKW